MDQRLAYIDALRGWAILAVVAVHCATWVPASVPWLNALAAHGGVGVQLFYVVSAFTLLRSAAARRGRASRPWREYVIRRFFRVAPLFYVAIVVYGPWRDALSPRYWMPGGTAPWHYLTAFTFTHGWHPFSVNALVPGGWSMAVEMTFYLLFPLLAACLTSLRRAVVFTVISLVAGMALSAWADAQYSPLVPAAHYRHIIESFAYVYMPSAQLCVFALGFVLFHLHGHVQAHPHRVPRWTGPVLVAVALAWLVTWVYVEVFALPEFFVLSLGFVPLALGVSLYPARLLVNRATCRLGELSYSIYLVHFGVIYALKFLLADFAITASPSANSVLAFLAVSAVSVLVASVSFRLVERPGVELGRRIVTGLRGVATRSPPPA